MNESQVPVEIE